MKKWLKQINTSKTHNALKRNECRRKKRQEYDDRKKALLDFKALKEDGISQGFAEGRAEGLAEGERVGIEKGERIGMEKGERIGRDRGRAEGERIREQQIIEKMRSEGFSEEQIRLICGA